MAIYIPEREFIRDYVFRNTRIRHGFVDVSKALEEAKPRDMIAYMIASSWDGPENSHSIPKPDKIAGLEGNGLTMAGIIADRRDYPLVVVRERFQLAGDEEDIISIVYENSNGKERTVELRKSSVYDSSSSKSGVPKIAIIDDVLRSGSKVMAATRAIRRACGKVVGVHVIVAVEDAPGLERLRAENIPVDYVIKINMEKLKTGEYSKKPDEGVL